MILTTAGSSRASDSLSLYTHATRVITRRFTEAWGVLAETFQTAPD